MWPQKTKNKTKSRDAVVDANQNLARIRARTSEVREVAADLRKLRERNHFAEQLQSIMGGSPNG